LTGFLGCSESEALHGCADDRIADGHTDKLCVDPIGEITALLKTSADEVLVRETGLWLVKHDLEKAMDVGSTPTNLTTDLHDHISEIR
jgi:hypothetical protein